MYMYVTRGSQINTYVSHVSHFHCICYEINCGEFSRYPTNMQSFKFQGQFNVRATFSVRFWSYISEPDRFVGTFNWVRFPISMFVICPYLLDTQTTLHTMGRQTRKQFLKSHIFVATHVKMNKVCQRETVVGILFLLCHYLKLFVALSKSSKTNPIWTTRFTVTNVENWSTWFILCEWTVDTLTTPYRMFFRWLAF